MGFKVLFTWKILALMMVGLTLGVFVGVLPGLGGPNGVAILLPLTFTMDPTSAIVMLSCIYWGALFGGAITSILFNIPGEAWSVATTFDGYPMAQKGPGGRGADGGVHVVVHRLARGVLLITFLAPRDRRVRAQVRARPSSSRSTCSLSVLSWAWGARASTRRSSRWRSACLLAGVGMDTVSGSCA
jgi:TctA family transporter